MSTLGRNSSQFVAQTQFGTAYTADDVLIIQVTVDEPENVAFLIDLYTHQPEESPTHLGCQYILPSALKHSEGALDVPVTCATRQSLLGMVRVEYLKVIDKNFPIDPTIRNLIPLIRRSLRYHIPKRCP